MTGFEKLTIDQLETFLERNASSPLQKLIEDAQVELLRKRIEVSLQYRADVKSGAAFSEYERTN